MIKSENLINIYEIDGKKTVACSDQRISIVSHWNMETFVIIEIPLEDGKKRSVTVNSRDLQAAINNATNTNRHG